MSEEPSLLVPALPGDSDQFLEEARRLVAEASRIRWLDGLFVVRISGWFGPRWLGFSGKAMGALGMSASDLTIPPFVPARVLQELYFENAGQMFRTAAAPFAVHKRQPSSENLQRRMAKLGPHCAFFWISSDSAAAGRAALMRYIPTEDGAHQGSYFGYVATNRLRMVARQSFPNSKPPAGRKARDQFSGTGRLR